MSNKGLKYVVEYQMTVDKKAVGIVLCDLSSKTGKYVRTVFAVGESNPAFNFECEIACKALNDSLKRA